MDISIAKSPLNGQSGPPKQVVAVLSGLKTCVGSILSSTRVRRRDEVGFGVDDSSTTFFGRPLLFTGAGAGVKSAS